jgi:hypothetical protein
LSWVGAIEQGTYSGCTKVSSWLESKQTKHAKKSHADWQDTSASDPVE